MKLASGAGHSPNCDGARGNGYSENAEAQKLNKLFIAICERNGVACVDCSSSAGSQTAYLTEQSRKFNASGASVKLQWHFNSGGGTGCECLFRPGGGGWQTASDISAAIAGVAGFKDRGAKSRTDLYILNTVSNAFIIEVAFIDSWSDMQAVVGKYPQIAAAVFKAVTGIDPEEDDMEPVDVWAYKNKAVNPNYIDVYDMLTRCTKAAEKIEAGTAEVDYEKLSDLVAGKIGDRVAAKVADLFAARLQE